MHAEKITLRTDAQGGLHGMPSLPPDTTVEVILLMPETAVASQPPHRRPPPQLKGKIKVLGDIVSSPVAADEWDALI